MPINIVYQYRWHFRRCSIYFFCWLESWCCSILPTVHFVLTVRKANMIRRWQRHIFIGGDVKKIASMLISITCLIPLAVSAQKIGGGDLVFSPKNALPVIFSHEKHVVRQDLKCTNCHYGVFQMAQGSDKMQMDKITKGDFCGQCHNGQKAFDVGDKANCSRCHRASQKWTVQTLLHARKWLFDRYIPTAEFPVIAIITTLFRIYQFVPKKYPINFVDNDKASGI